MGAVDLGRRDGRRYRRTFYGGTRREVRDKLDAAIHQKKTGGLPTAGRQTVGQFLTAWLEEVAKPRLRPSTYRSYSDLIRLHVIPDLGHIRLERLSAQDVQRMMNAKLEDGLSPRRVQYIRAVMRAALNQAVNWGLVPRNAAGITSAPRSIKHPVRVLTPGDAQRLLDAARGDRLEALYTVALSLGLRQGEALGLRWSDVDLSSRTLSVVYALQRVGGKLQLVEPKTDRSRRTIRLPAIVADALREHERRQQDDRKAAGERWQTSGLVFTTTIGTPLDGTTVTHQFQRLLVKANLPKIRFHDLRHSCASLLLAQGVSPRVVMETLGHSQISLTMNTYTHVIPAVQAEAADAMDRLLLGSAGDQAGGIAVSSSRSRAARTTTTRSPGRIAGISPRATSS